MKGAFHKNAFILLAHKNQDYLNQIKSEIMKKEHIYAVDIEDLTAVYAFVPCHLSMYSLRRPNLRVIYPHAVLFRCAKASTLIADIMTEVADVVCKNGEEGIVCIIPEDLIEKLQKHSPPKLAGDQMELAQLLDPENIIFDQGGKDKWTILKSLCQIAYDRKLVDDQNVFFDSITKREQIQSTGIGGGLAFPHVRCPSVKQPFLIIMLCQTDVNFESLDDNPVRFIALIGFPDDGPSHLPILSQLNGLLLDEKTKQHLLSCHNSNDVIRFIRKEN